MQEYTEWLLKIFDSLMNFEWLQHLIAPAFVGIVIGWLSMRAQRNNLFREIKLERKKNAADALLPVLLELLEDLFTLEEAFIFRGNYCPSIEHRAANLTMYDDKGDNISFAERQFQFRKIGYRIINNCRIVIFLTKDKQLEGSRGVCKEILNYLNRRISGKKRPLDYFIGRLSDYWDSHLDNNSKIELNSEIKHIKNNLGEFHSELERLIEKELPSLVHVQVDDND